MTVDQLLDVPADDILELTDGELDRLLGDLIPQSRTPDASSSKGVQKMQDDLKKIQALAASLLKTQ